MKVLHSNQFRRDGSYGEVEIEIVPRVIQLTQHYLDDKSEIVQFDRSDIPENHHLRSGIDMSAERSRRSKELKSNEVIGDQRDSLILVHLFFNRLAENAVTKIIVVLQRFLKTLTYLP